MRLARCCLLRGGCDVTNQALPGRPPAHDLSAFDLSKRSPEQVALSFARWKAQRKRQAEAGTARADSVANLKPEPEVAKKPTGDAAPGDSAAAAKRASAKRAESLRYSAPFSDLLAAGSEPTVQRSAWPTIAALRPPQRTASRGRRLRVMSILAGAASVCVLAGGALLEFADRSDPAETAPQVAQVRPREIVRALAASATSVATVEWTLQPMVDLVLMKANAASSAPPTPVPPTPAIRTASTAAPVAADKPVLPARKSTVPETAQFVARPFVPDVVPAPIPMAQEAAPVPAPPVAAEVHTGDPRPDALFQHERDSRNAVASNRAASSGKPAAATGPAGAVDARSASVRNATVANGGNRDPRGEGSGGARASVAGEVGAGTASDANGGVGGGTGGAGDAGDASGGGSSGGSSSGGAGAGGEPAGAATGDSSTGGGTAADSAGSGDPGAGDSGNSDAGAGESGDGDSGGDGESGGIGAALGAVGDAFGGAPGGGKGNPDSNDKDQRN